MTPLDDVAIGKGQHSRDPVLKMERQKNAELRQEIIRLRDDLENLAKACDKEGEVNFGNAVRYILGNSIERGAL